MKEFKYKLKIEAEPEDVYAAFTNPFTLELWTGYPATMSTEVGSEFSLWEGDITGINLEFVENEKLVQEWYFGEQEEKSIVTVKFFKERKHTKVELVHTNIPDEAYEEMTEGWKEYFLGGIKEFLEIDDE